MRHLKSSQRSKGMALLISGVVLLVVLMLTMTSIKNTQSNQQIATNFQSKIEGQAAAQAAVNEAKTFLSSQKPNTVLFTSNCQNGLCTDQKTGSIWNSASAWTNPVQLQSNLQSKTNILSNPKYIIEYVGDKTSQDSLSVGSGDYGNNKDVSTKPVYRITGKAQGQKGTKQTIIQSTVY